MAFKLDSNFRTAFILTVIAALYANGQVNTNTMFFNNPPNYWYAVPIAVFIGAYMLLNNRTTFLSDDDIRWEDPRVLYEFVIHHPLVRQTFSGNIKSSSYEIPSFLCAPDGTFIISLKDKNTNKKATYFIDGRKDVSPRKISFITGVALDELGVNNILHLARQLRTKGKTNFLDLLEDFDDDQRKEVILEGIKRGGGMLE